MTTRILIDTIKRMFRSILSLSLFLAIIAMPVIFTSCKTTEANYKAAYDKAKSKGESEGVDQEVYQRIAREELPDTVTIDKVTLPVKRLFLVDSKLNEGEKVVVNRYNVVTAKFRQTFNARSMTARLKESGFNNAFVAADRNSNYYVVAASVPDAAQAWEALDSVRQKQVGSVAPFPYVIVVN